MDFLTEFTEAALEEFRNTREVYWEAKSASRDFRILPRVSIDKNDSIGLD